jgi:hypothetical protein
MVNDALDVDVFPNDAPQPAAPYDTHSYHDGYRVFCTSYKRATRPGMLLATVEFFIPSFQLHLSCRLQRDDRGHQRLDLPRTKVEAPDGRIHHKSLMRWHTAQAEALFQQLGLAAIAEFQRNAATRRDPLPTQPRIAPCSGATTSLTLSRSSEPSPSSTNC